MNIVSGSASLSPAIIRLRAATAEIHHRLEQRLDIVARLSDPTTRVEMLRRFAAFHLGAEGPLAPWLAGVPSLDLPGRRRAPLLATFVGPQPAPSFPAPVSRAEALGMLYVLEGSALGGRLILRTLADRGVRDSRLAFLDPYGGETGSRWRGFLAVLAREISDERRTAGACRGAVLAFQHAECLLCGGVA